jgi:hypothetical protein
VGITLFAPLFLLFAIYACLGERQWVTATLTSAFLQGATPILLSAGGRITGIQTAYALLPIGVLHLVLSELKRARQLPAPEPERGNAWGIDLPDALFLATTAIGVAGAILLPRILNGVVLVLPPSVGYHAEPLHPSSRNVIQGFYMVCNLFLYVLISRSVCRRVVTVSQCIGALAVGAWFAIALGVYQFLGSFAPLPWPSAIFNSNLGVTQLYDQSAYGIRRMSSTFLEPSILSMHFVGLFALFGLGLKRRLLGLALLGCLLISTSATAYVGLLFLGFVWLAFAVPRMSLQAFSTLAIVAAVAVGLLVVGLFSFDQLPGAHLVAQKLSSHSGTVRTAADSVNVQALWDSWGLGTGVGSTRSSSILATFAACAGIPGLACLAAFFGVLLVRGARAMSPEARALSLGLGGLTLGWLTSVPDLTLALVWLFAGLVRGATAPGVITQPAPATERSFEVFPKKLRPVRDYAGRSLPQRD